jgi:acyl carrier protein
VAETSTDIYEATKEAVVGALGVGEDEVTPDSTLMDDLGAESIDLLDILFRIERSTGTKVQASDIGDYIQGGIPDEEFGEEGGVLTDKGFDQLKKAMPQVDESLRGQVKPEEVMSHFTVGNLAELVKQRAGGQ